MADMEQLVSLYLYQVRDQNPASGPLVLDKAMLAPQAPIVVSAVSDTTQTGDTIALLFNGKQLGDSLLVKDPNELVYDLLVKPDDWPEATADVYVTVTRSAAIVASSKPVSLQVMSTVLVGDVQRYEGFLSGTYNPGIVDSWVVSGAYSIASAAQIPMSVLVTGQNVQGTQLDLMRVTTTAGGVTELRAVCLWKYDKGEWQGSFVDSDVLQLARGDHLAMFVPGRDPASLALEFVI